jgi:hypothetical protein
MSSYSSGIGSSIARLACALIALCGSVAAQAQSIQMAASLSYNSTYNYYTGTYSDPNIIYGVTVTPQTGLPPSLSLIIPPLPINPLNYNGFTNNGLVYAPSSTGATVDLIGGSNGWIYRFFGPTFSGTPGSAAPNAVTIWSACGGEESEVVRASAAVTPSSPSESSGCNGPENPGAMAIDGNGVLYVLSVDGGNSNCDGQVVELWAFVPLASSPSGFNPTPVLIDNNVAGPGTSNCSPRDYSNNDISFSQSAKLGFNPNPYTVYDLMIAPSYVAAPLTPNDVLVLFGDSQYNYPAPQNVVALLADYNASTLAAVLKGSATLPLNQPLTVLNSTDITHWSQAPTGVGAAWVPVVGDNALSVAAWPADDNLLLLDQDGNIFKFTWSTTCSVASAMSCSVINQPVFWSLLPNYNSNVETENTAYPNMQVESLRTGAQAGASYAFVTAYTLSEGPVPPSDILALDNSGGINSPQSVATSVGPFAALAVSSPPSGSGSGTAAQCVIGCDLTGGDQQQIMGTPAAIAAVEALGAKGTITENVCIVEQDPRHICNKNAPPAPGNPWYNSKTLPISAVCPNSYFKPSFGNTVIPDYICGDYGSGGPGTGTGFAVIQGIANGVDGISGLLVYNDANADAFFDPGQAEPCTGGEPITLFGWAPWSGSPVEGSIPESPNMIELTYGCGTSKATSSGMSIDLVGAKLSLATASEFKPNNVSFAQFKYANLFTDVLVAPIDFVQKVRLEEIIVRSEVFLDQGEYSCAARKIWRADEYVSDHAGHFHGIPGFDPNSYGRSRSRLANLFFTIFSRIEGNLAPQVWPIAKPPGVCPGNIDIDPDGY